MPEVNKDIKKELYNLRLQLVNAKMSKDQEEINRIEEQIKVVRKRIADDLYKQIKEEKSRGKNN